MWENSEVKARGKARFKANYWICVLASLILSLFTGENSMNLNIDLSDLRNIFDIGGGDTTSSLGSDFINALPTALSFVLEHLSRIATTSIVLFVGVLGFLIIIFIFNVIEVGGCRFFLINSEEKAKVGEILAPFSEDGYLEIVKTQFFRDLFTTLWTLLLIIPGIVKSYEYRMMPYIMADPEFADLKQSDIFALSKKMTKGNKFDLFIFGWSFIGWMLLATITMGLVGVFYYYPYKNASMAEVYLTLKEKTLY